MLVVHAGVLNLSQSMRWENFSQSREMVRKSRLVNQHLFEALNGSRFHILDITSLSVFRADAHPLTTGGKKHEDCMHWCLPGLPDIWNDLFVATLETLQIK